jgi:hypothetical protein
LSPFIETHFPYYMEKELSMYDTPNCINRREFSLRCIVPGAAGALYGRAVSFLVNALDLVMIIDIAYLDTFY